MTRDEYATVRDRLETLRTKARRRTRSRRSRCSTSPRSRRSGRCRSARRARRPAADAAQFRHGQGRTAVRGDDDPRLRDWTARSSFRPGRSCAGSSARCGRPARSIARQPDAVVRRAAHRDRDRIELRASVTQALDGKIAQDATRIGAGAVVGGIIGGILGGGKGALLGVLVGGGGTIAATEGRRRPAGRHDPADPAGSAGRHRQVGLGLEAEAEAQRKPQAPSPKPGREPVELPARVSRRTCL